MQIRWLRTSLSVLGYLFYLGIIIVAFDMVVLRWLFEYGYPRHYDEENVLRYPAPYVMFTGKPHARDHNELGFRGPSLAEAEPDQFKIAFFGGSTGYEGRPSVASALETELDGLLDVDVFVANYSVVSSNHRQHLHGIIEYLPMYNPDLVVFYGGFNETVGPRTYDPRPNYPYNYFFRGETSPIVKILVKHSAIIGEMDKKWGMFTGIRRLRVEQQVGSTGWWERVTEGYLDTLEVAGSVTGALSSKHCGNTRFLAFYQPYRVPNDLLPIHEDIKLGIEAMSYVFDVSSEYDRFGDEIFTDIVHVKQEARNSMGKRLAQIIAGHLKGGELGGCLDDSRGMGGGHGDGS